MDLASRSFSIVRRLLFLSSRGLHLSSPLLGSLSTSLSSFLTGLLSSIGWACCVYTHVRRMGITRVTRLMRRHVHGT